MIINIDYTKRCPIYEQIVTEIEREITLGILKPNAQIPSVRTLACDLGINPNTVKKAYDILEENMDTIENIVNKYGVVHTISLGKNYFPEKEYEGVKIPSGEYESLVITLGSGKGENWWCVMFPPLCLLEAKDNNTENVEYKFFVQEILEKYTS